MTNDWKKNFVYYSVLSLLVLSTVVVTALKLNVELAAAQGGCSVVVTGDGATCTNGGSNPGGGSDDGGSTTDPGNPGSDDTNNGGGSDDGNNNNDDGNGDGDTGSCTPGTVSSGTLTVQAGSGGLVTSDGTVIPLGSYQLPGGAWVPAGEVPPNMCFTSAATVDSCTGEVYGSQLATNFIGGAIVSECPGDETHTPPTPCDEFVVTSGGVTCTTDFVTSDS